MLLGPTKTAQTLLKFGSVESLPWIQFSCMLIYVAVVFAMYKWWTGTQRLYKLFMLIPIWTKAAPPVVPNPKCLRQNSAATIHSSSEKSTLHAPPCFLITANSCTMMTYFRRLVFDLVLLLLWASPWAQYIPVAVSVYSSEVSASQNIFMLS